MVERSPAPADVAEPRRRPRARRLIAVGATVGAVLLALAIGLHLVGVLPAAYVVMVFLVAVLAVAALFGLWPGIAAALGSFFAYNFFFVEPTFTFDVADPREVFALGVFLAAAILTGGLAGRLREVADAARRRADTLAVLNEFAARISATADLDLIRSLIVRFVAERIDGAVVLIERTAAADTVAAAWPGDTTLTPDERRAVARVFATGEAGPRAMTTPERRFVFRPLVTAEGTLAVVGLAAPTGADLEPERGLPVLLDQAATALERARFAEERAAAAAAVEQERLRSALLSSISHDLRTPLATILGSVTSLRQLGDRMDARDRADLLAAIEEETDRLSRFVADLLAMTRLEAGLDVRRDWIDAADVVRAAADHLRRVHPAHEFRLRVATPLPPVRGDATLLEQVLFNLGDNAAKASPPATPIDLDIARAADTLVLAITDRGRGMSADERARLFGDTEPHGATTPPETRGGLGLAIVRRVVTAMAGTVVAESPSPLGDGTRVTLRLPIEDAALPDGQEAPEP